jgi:hypothetical protein
MKVKWGEPAQVLRESLQPQPKPKNPNPLPDLMPRPNLQSTNPNYSPLQPPSEPNT